MSDAFAMSLRSVANQLRDHKGEPEVAAIIDAAADSIDSLSAQSQAAGMQECIKLVDAEIANLHAGFGWGAWTEDEYRQRLGTAEKIKRDLSALALTRPQPQDPTT